ncbi:hypothetical protein D7294_17535 [Streptomyces hoynatensis]|uniref:Uncharacterized protein n=1 Tax=Streptomyces hoynatensis TaxID=1141874 RepID=A0A3A9Z0C5_9ACTN|nr:hypothetical protein D7294_17535 [Streptomyces hoynatensis]
MRRLHMPVGKAIALAAMPSAALMGMGFTSPLAKADPQPANPFQDGPCVEIPDEGLPEEYAELFETAEGVETDPGAEDPEDDAGDGADAGDAAEEGAGEAAEDGSGDEADADGTREADQGGRQGAAEDSREPADEREEDGGSADSPETDENQGGAEDGEEAETGEGEDAESGSSGGLLGGLLGGVGDTLGGLGNAVGGLLDPSGRQAGEETGERDAAGQDEAPAGDAGQDGQEARDGAAEDGESGGAADEPEGEEAGDEAEGSGDAEGAGDAGDAGDAEADDGTAEDAAGDEAGAADEEAQDPAAGDPFAPDDQGRLPYPCPLELEVAGTGEQTPMTLPNDPWYLQASSLLLRGLHYHGVVNVVTADGSVKQVLKFTAEKVDIGDLHQIVDAENGVRYHVATAPGSNSTFRNGTVTMYTERLQGNLFGLIPTVYDPAHQPPLDLPLAYFTDVFVAQAGQFGGDLTLQGMNMYTTEDGPTQIPD